MSTYTGVTNFQKTVRFLAHPVLPRIFYGSNKNIFLHASFACYYSFHKLMYFSI